MVKSILKQVLFAGLCFLLNLDKVEAQDNIANQVQLIWRTASTYNGTDNLNLNIILKNVSTKPVDLKSWNLLFNSMFPVVEKKTKAYQFSNENGNLFKLQFEDQVISPNDSLVFDYQTLYPIANISTVPEGFYFQNKTDIYKYYVLNNLIYQPILQENSNDFYTSLYEKNERLNVKANYPLVFPTPKSLDLGKGFITLKSGLSFYLEPKFTSSQPLTSAIQSLFVNSLPAKNSKESKLIVKEKKELPVEAYELKIDQSGVFISSSSEKGVFYAIQSLRSMPYKISGSGKNTEFTFPCVKIFDEPRFGYRGFMLDIARNFKDKEVVKKYLDLMAAYKLNVFHFHFIDDEGWRIEIPTLPELTEVGARRSPSYMDGNSIHPAYGSGGMNTSANYLTRADFIEILKYAKERFITVIPEIETPGHARAAIKSMETRYHRLMKLGKKDEALAYLLHDFEDVSVYNSAQNFNDNILNPALPSVYTFISTVLDDFKKMYAEAGVDFSVVSMGGDEVPNGVWEKSPKIKELMQSEGFTSVNQVWPYYIQRINAICKSKGLKMAGWEEVGMVNKGKGMVVNQDLPSKDNLLLDVWNNVIGGGQEDLAYRLANAGYPTVLISASNMYFDMIWNSNFMEPGLSWATRADLYHSFSLLPEDFFANIDTYYKAKNLGKQGFKDRVRLTDFGKKHLVGIKGGLFAETIHSESKLDYMVFPRFFTLTERAWSTKRSYEDEVAFTTLAFEQDYIKLVNRISSVDLPRLSPKFAFRLPAVGVKLEGDRLFANTEYMDSNIYYTTDGSKPSLNSNKYNKNAGVKYNKSEKYVFVVLDNEGRAGQYSYFN